MTTLILKLPQVRQATGLSRSSIYAFVKKGTFPKPIKLGEKAVGWIEGEVSAWVAARASLRDQVGAE